MLVIGITYKNNDSVSDYVGHSMELTMTAIKQCRVFARFITSEQFYAGKVDVLKH